MGAGEGGHTPLENLGDVTFPGKLEPPPPWKNEERKKTLEWDILNPNRLINLEIKNKRRTSIIQFRD